MLSIEEARARILAQVSALPPERVPLLDALGRHLASALAAREDAPPFDASAMDGWALACADLEGASSLPAKGESSAGSAPGVLERGTAMRIFTGAPVPEHADAVVMQEDVEREGDLVRFREVPRAFANIRRRGEEIERGAELLPAGARIGSGEVGLLASQSYPNVSVHRRPRVAILGTGDELRDIGDAPRPGSIVDSNAYALAAAVREQGGVPLVLPRVPDRKAAITEAIRAGLEADALITTGGVSVGDHDLVHAALREAGVETLFWKVRMKPGKPLAFGLGPRGTPVFGLPGNPVSAWVTFELFVRPALRRMQGDPSPERRELAVVLATPLKHKPGRTELVRARLEARGDHTAAIPFRTQSSGALVSMAGVDALVVIPAEMEDPPEGTRLGALLLR